MGLLFSSVYRMLSLNFYSICGITGGLHFRYRTKGLVCCFFLCGLLGGLSFSELCSFLVGLIYCLLGRLRCFHRDSLILGLSSDLSGRISLVNRLLCGGFTRCLNPRERRVGDPFNLVVNVLTGAFVVRI